MMLPFSGPSSLLAVLVVAPAVLLSCCGTGASLKDNRFENDHVGYGLGAPGEGWTQVKLEGTDVVWHNPALAAGLLVNSHCEGVADSPLEGLTGELMMGSTEREILSQIVRPASGREAMETVATAKLDGVLRKRALYVLKKDGCVYDVVYDAAPDRFDAGLDAYHRVRDGLVVGPRRDRG